MPVTNLQHYSNPQTEYKMNFDRCIPNLMWRRAISGICDAFSRSGSREKITTNTLFAIWRTCVYARRVSVHYPRPKYKYKRGWNVLHGPDVFLALARVFYPESFVWFGGNRGRKDRWYFSWNIRRPPARLRGPDSAWSPLRINGSLSSIIIIGFSGDSLDISGNFDTLSNSRRYYEDYFVTSLILDSSRWSV